MKYWIRVYFTLVLIAFMSAPYAGAQTVTTRSVDQKTINACRVHAMELMQRATQLRADIEAIANCNAQGMLYQGGGCVDPLPALSMAHFHDDLDTGDTLALADPDGLFRTTVVIGGADAENLVCREFYDCDGSVTWEQNGLSCSSSTVSTNHGDTRIVTDNTAPNIGSADIRCNDGGWDILSGTCEYGGCALPWGGNLDHNDSVTAYETDSVPFGESCNSETRTCTGGTLSGSFQYESCAPETPADCALDGVTIAHGTSETFYMNSRSCGEDCADVSGIRSCNDGIIGGSTDYSQASCPDEDVCPAYTWQPWFGTLDTESFSNYGTSPDVIMATFDAGCDAGIWPVSCQGCTPWPAQTCTPGAPCSGTGEDPCLINQRTCTMGGGATATIWDRYECRE